MDENLRRCACGLCCALLVWDALGEDACLDDWPCGDPYALYSGVLNLSRRLIVCDVSLWQASLLEWLCHVNLTSRYFRLTVFLGANCRRHDVPFVLRFSSEFSKFLSYVYVTSVIEEIVNLAVG